MKEKPSNLNNVICIFAVIAIIISIANVSMSLYKFSEYKKSITGNTLGSGYVNVTVSTQLAVNFSRDTLNWGPGIVSAGETNATLSTSQEAATASRGNWSTTNAKGLILANIGNLNASIVLAGTKTGTTFFGGSTPEYKWNITAKDTNPCISTSFTLGQWYAVNTTAKICSHLGYLAAANEIYIDILLTVPYDATITGIQSDTITATASTAG